MTATTQSAVRFAMAVPHRDECQPQCPRKPVLTSTSVMSGATLGRPELALRAGFRCAVVTAHSGSTLGASPDEPAALAAERGGLRLAVVAALQLLLSRQGAVYAGRAGTATVRAAHLQVFTVNEGLIVPTTVNQDREVFAIFELPEILPRRDEFR
jgi:hypothetical protein